MTAFALADSSGAVHVAASAHHTLVLTRDGEMYSCGLGKGGRLGTGHEKSLPHPAHIAALSRHVVTHCAAAENHSLCCTRDGQVFAWGSNRFGQITSSSSHNNHFKPGQDKNSNQNGHNSTAMFTTPKRVEELRNIKCILVAAGEKHSVALTRDGQVYTWGDNASGQLGRRTRHQKGPVDRVDALWNNDRVAIDISASDHSTLALVQAPTTGIHQAVYSWGHGNPFPIRIQLQTADQQDFASNKNSNGDAAAGLDINPVAVACGKHHNVVLTKNGSVYTWGFHAESLGNNNNSATRQSQQQNQSSNSTRLANRVSLPEKAVAVSASDNHTGVVTDRGHLYTWGATFDKNVMGHEGVRYQPSPKRVEGVHRAIGVAVAKEHTVLLMGTAFPPLPEVPVDNAVLSLECLAARRVMRHVDLFNVVPVALLADKNQSWWLQQYCRDFIRLNLDGVLLVGRKGEMDLYLNACLQEPYPCLEPDDPLIHPLVSEVLHPNQYEDRDGWVRACQDLLSRLPVAARVKYLQQQQRKESFSKQSFQLHTSAGQPSVLRGRASSFHERHHGQQEQQQQQQQQQFSSSLETGVQGCSERCLVLTAGLQALTVDRDILSKHACLSKELRGIRKRLGQIAKLVAREQGTGAKVKEECRLTAEEMNKLARKPLLEADLIHLEQAMAKLDIMMGQRNLVSSKDRSERDVTESVADNPSTDGQHHQKKGAAMAADSKAPTMETDPLTEDTDTKFDCRLCNVCCPDAHSLELHRQGRKHRNRLLQAQKEREAQTAASLERTKLCATKPAGSSDQVSTTNASPTVSFQKKKKKTSPWSSDPVQPRYKLAPPPHSIVPPVKAPGMSWGIKPTESPSGNGATSVASANFRSILAEQENKQKAKQRAVTASPKLSATALPTAKLLSPGPLPPLKAAPWMTAPVARIPMPATKPISTRPTTASPTIPKPVQPTVASPNTSTPNSKSGSGKKVSLAEFMTSPRKAPKIPDTSKAAPWSSPQAVPTPSTPTGSGGSAPGIPVAPGTPAGGLSLADIQREEESLKSHQDQNLARDAKWYIQRRGRVGSFSTIVEEEAKREEAMRLMVEEQYRIQEEIERLNLQKQQQQEEEEQQKTMKEKKKGKGRRKKKPNRSNSDGGKGDGKSSAQSETKKTVKRNRNRNKKQQATTSKTVSDTARNETGTPTTVVST